MKAVDNVEVLWLVRVNGGSWRASEDFQWRKQDSSSSYFWNAWLKISNFKAQYLCLHLYLVTTLYTDVLKLQEQDISNMAHCNIDSL